MSRVNRKGGSRRGETLPEVLTALLIMALALSLLFRALSLLLPPEPIKREQTRSSVHTTFWLGETQYETELDVLLTEEGYTYARDG